MSGHRGSGEHDRPSAWSHPGLIGRTTDLWRAREALDAARLVTLTGVGGVGKTSLAVNLADELRAAGWAVAFVDMHAATGADQLPEDVAAAIGAHDPAGAAPEERLVRATANGSRCLIVLDNLEQLVGAADATERLLEIARGLSILATSRVPLGAQSEMVVPITPLALPSSEARTGLLDAPACALFVERARQVRPTPPMDAASERDIADLCRALDGIPLAIELAAARTRLLAPRAILRRLHEGSAETLLSTPGDKGRHSSLEVVFELSLSLLSDSGRAALLAVSVCPGPFDLNMATRLYPGIDTLSAFEDLVEAQLVRHELDDTGEAQMRLLETVRTSSLARLSANELVQLRDRHLRATLEDVGAERESMLGADRVRAVERLNSRLADVRSAFDFALARDPDAAITLIAPVWRFWPAVGRAQEGADRLRSALAQRPNDATSARAWGFAALAGITHVLEGNAGAASPARHAIRIARRVGDPSAELEALPGAALAAIDSGDPRGGIRWSRRAALLARRIGDRRALVRALATLGMAHGELGLVPEAVRYLGQAVHEAHADADTFNEGIQLSNLAQLEIDQGRPRQALGHASASVIVLRGLDAGWYLGAALVVEGQAMAETGRLDEARSSFAEAARLIRAVGVSTTAGELIARSIPYLLRVGALELALRGLRAVQQQVASAGRKTVPLYVRRAEQEVAAVMPQVGVRRMESLFEREAARPLDVLEELIDFLTRAGAQRLTRIEHAAFAFTPREAEVARLLGRGWSDRQISTELGISEKTASVHVSNIKGKLGVESRLEAAIAGRILENSSALGRSEGGPP